ncbi:MAG: hypothetical protein WCG80_14575 [Spirochaetales bacterium]
MRRFPLLLALTALLGVSACDINMLVPMDSPTDKHSPANANGTKKITAFTFSAVSGASGGTIEQASGAISVAVPYGTDLTALVPTIVFDGDTVSPASGVAHDFTKPATYTVTATDGTTKDYTVSIAPSSAKEILTFAFSSPAATGIIDSTAGTIAITVPYSTTTLNGLVPTFSINGASVAPASGVARDFSLPVTYVITAEDGTTRTYTVTVTKATASANDITGFTFSAPSVTGTIADSSATSGTVSVGVPYGTVRTSLTPSITISGASISPATGIAQNFTNPVTYTVTAADSTTKTYTVTVAELPSAPIVNATSAGANPSLAGTQAVTLKFTGAGATSYEIYYVAGGNGATTADTLAPSANVSWTYGTPNLAVISGLADGTSYSFIVRGVNAAGTGPISTPVTVWTIPAAPMLGLSQPNSTNSIDISIVMLGPGVSQYRVYYSTSSFTEGTLPSSPSPIVTASTSLTIPGLTSGTAYYVGVFAVNNQANPPTTSPLSTVQQFSTASPLAAPTNVKASATTTTATVSFGTVSGSSDYEVYYSTATFGSGNLPGTPVATGSSPAIVPNLTTNMTYYVGVASHNGSLRTLSSLITVTTKAVPRFEVAVVADGLGLYAAKVDLGTGALTATTPPGVPTSGSGITYSYYTSLRADPTGKYLAVGTSGTGAQTMGLHEWSIDTSSGALGFLGSYTSANFSLPASTVMPLFSPTGSVLYNWSTPNSATTTGYDAFTTGASLWSKNGTTVLGEVLNHLVLSPDGTMMFTANTGTNNNISAYTVAAPTWYLTVPGSPYVKLASHATGLAATILAVNPASSYLVSYGSGYLSAYAVSPSTGISRTDSVAVYLPAPTGGAITIVNSPGGYPVSAPGLFFNPSGTAFYLWGLQGATHYLWQYHLSATGALVSDFLFSTYDDVRSITFNKTGDKAYLVYLNGMSWYVKTYNTNMTASGSSGQWSAPGADLTIVAKPVSQFATSQPLVDPSGTYAVVDYNDGVLNTMYHHQLQLYKLSDGTHTTSSFDVLTNMNNYAATLAAIAEVY